MKIIVLMVVVVMVLVVAVVVVVVVVVAVVVVVVVGCEWNITSFVRLCRSLNVADDVTGVTPLQVAVETGNIDCIREMVICGAQVDAVDRTGRTVFHYAARCSNEMIIQVCYHTGVLERTAMLTFHFSSFLRLAQENNSINNCFMTICRSTYVSWHRRKEMEDVVCAKLY